VPNSSILASEIVNYSSLARERGLILHTTVGIRYDIPWRQADAMLLEAAARTSGALREPAPYVLKKEFKDCNVTYEINVYCDSAQKMASIYTELHGNILDVFNEYGVQIMTPAYEGDPEQPKIVPRNQWYAAPARPPRASVTTNAEKPLSGSLEVIFELRHLELLLAVLRQCLELRILAADMAVEPAIRGACGFVNARRVGGFTSPDRIDHL
jgi:hypothetical protein